MTFSISRKLAERPGVDTRDKPAHDESRRMLHLRARGFAPLAIEQAKAVSGLGLFVRSLVGMDRAAAKEAFAGFIAGKALTANQIELVDMIVEQLTENGVMDAARLYESPYTDLNPLGVDGLFSQAAVEEVFAILEDVRQTAAA
jgi:type I restriction enzyme R subunit